MLFYPLNRVASTTWICWHGKYAPFASLLVIVCLVEPSAGKLCHDGITAVLRAAVVVCGKCNLAYPRCWSCCCEN